MGIDTARSQRDNIHYWTPKYNTTMKKRLIVRYAIDVIPLTHEFHVKEHSTIYDDGA